MLYNYFMEFVVGAFLALLVAIGVAIYQAYQNYIVNPPKNDTLLSNFFEKLTNNKPPKNT